MIESGKYDKSGYYRELSIYLTIYQENDIIVSFPKDSKAGITIHNNYDWFGMGKRGPWVVISKINDKYECYKGGLPEKDIIILFPVLITNKR
jgi:hypothetical protein